ncbi:Uncharacterised protein [Actinobacillus pleuropneumoniae]|nr:Uncharacterised protein [Actinobacillus pleuropneumoniae]
MVQTQRDQQSVGRAENERSDASETDNPVAEGGNAILDRAPNHADQHGQHHRGGCRDNRNKAFTRKEAQPIRHFYVVEFVIQVGGPQTDKETAKNAHIQLHVIRYKRHLQRHLRQHSCKHHVPDKGGETRNGVSGESDRNADRKNNRQIIQNG